MSRHPLHQLLHPRSVAVVGASASGRGGGFVRPLQELGFKGPIYPVNPKYEEVMGLKAYARVSDIPAPVDYVISSIPASQVLGLVDDCVARGVKCLHLFTARFSETGRQEAAALEQEILRRARAGGVRIIGPNCMGVYYPAAGLGFNEGMPAEPGRVGVASQSGQAVGEIVGSAAARGVRFSKGISYGNALDFNECDYLEYLTEDEETDIILLYIEGVRDGPRFLQVLRAAAAAKPVVVVKGGRGEAGTRATASHTASLAGSRAVWDALVRQTGVVPARDLEEMVDIAVAFYRLPPLGGRRVGVVGGSGGSSVLAADICEEEGLNVVPLPDDIRQELRRQGNAIWDWINNPADFSISMGDDSSANAVTRLMARHPDFDVMIAYAGGPWRRGPEPFSLEDHFKRMGVEELAGKPTAIVFTERPRRRNADFPDYEQIVASIKERLISMGFPVYPTVKRAAFALSRVVSYYEKR